jgi:hypothetical protein
MPLNTVKVDRSTKWGNPFVCVTKARSVSRFREWLQNTNAGKDMKRKAAAELRGKNLACWCKPDEPCHADVLLRLANAVITNAADGSTIDL